MINEFEKICSNRKSIRKFSDKLIEENKIMKILNIINSAPSAGNLQSYEVVVIKSKDTKIKIYEASLFQGFIAEAPVVLVFIAKAQEASKHYGERGEYLYSIQDATIACTYAMLACEALDISSTWVGAFNEGKIKEILHCKKGEIPVALLPIGYTLSNKISFSSRKELNELTREI
jgi:nitroreductase